MRIAAILIGIVLLVAGIWVVTGHGSYQGTDTALQIGEFAVQTTTEKAIPQWAGIAGIVVGALLLIGGFLGLRKR